MQIETTPLADVLVLTPRVHRDERGFFVESYNQQTLANHGIQTPFVQDNQSRSVRNTVRGMHYQIGAGQVKLVRAISGTIYDVVVDIRHGSPTFGQWFGIELSAENFKQLYIPVGFAHGFCVLSETADLAYKCSSTYAPALERGLAWNDPTVGIVWPVEAPILSVRDQQQPTLDRIDQDFMWQPELLSRPI